VSEAALLLFVEDEPLILIEAKDALEAGGYAVIDAETGAAAMAILDSRVGELSGLITDVRLGKAPDGWAIARRARELKPTLPVVYATADGAPDWAAQGVPKSLVVQKPYASAQLVAAISSLITEADTEGSVRPSV